MRNSVFILIIFVMTTLAKSQNEDINYYIGERLGGGIIFYIDEAGQYILIAAPYDQSNGIRWGCSHQKIDASSFNDGFANSKIIVSECGENTAAALCLNLDIGGYHDWYLPALNELELLYKSSYKIDGLTPNDYCSSSEYSKGGNDCWAIHFGRNGKNFYYNKSELYFVRAIRKFYIARTDKSLIGNSTADKSFTSTTLYLINGSKIQGLIIEKKSNEYIKIQRSDGSVFKFKTNEIEKIEGDYDNIPESSISTDQNDADIYQELPNKFPEFGFEVGDKVRFEINEIIYKGKIIELKENYAVIELIDEYGLISKYNVEYKKIKKSK